MQTQLQELKDNLIKARNPVVEFLRRPIVSDEQITELLLKHNYQLQTVPGSLVDLYHWHDGTLDEHDNVHPYAFYIIPEFSFLSLEKIDEIISNANDTYEFVDNNLLPMFMDYNGAYLSLDLNSDVGRFYYSSTWSGDLELHTQIFDSFISFMNTINEAYSNGDFYLNDDNLIDNSDSYFELCRKNNPLSDYWKIMV